MSPKIWGPPIWIFFHTFTVNISDYGYFKVGMQFFSYITRICKMLPCPECAEHATKYISKIPASSLKTKKDMANMLYAFHNIVNARKRLPLFIHSNLSYYEKVPIINSFNAFAYAFTIPTQRLMNENLHRKLLIRQMNQFIVEVIRNGYFNKPIPVIPVNTVKNIEENKSTEKIELQDTNIITMTVIDQPNAIYEDAFVSDSDNSSIISSSTEKSEETN